MITKTPLALTCAILLDSACEPKNRYSYDGHRVSDYFSMDGERSWEYAQVDEEVMWNMRIDKVAEERVGDHDIVTLEYWGEDIEGDGNWLVYEVQWSADSVDGVLIHNYTMDGEDTVVFDPPVVVAGYQMVSGASVSTSTAGKTYTGTFVGIEDCPNYWTTDVWECAHLILDDGDDDDSNNAPFVGEMWMANNWGASRFTGAGYDTDWVLKKATWSEDLD